MDVMTVSNELRDQMDRLVGAWRSEGRFIDGGEFDGQIWQGYDVYEWFPGGQHLVHRVDVTMFGVRKEAIEFFTPREGSPDSFDQVSFDADGMLERGSGRFDEQGRYHNDVGQARAVLTIHGPESMTARWELQQSDGQWTPWMDMTFTRISDPHIEIRSKDDHTC